ncbi:MAG: hypothetical protein NVSMB32_08910 [Actinomycetota bacterium]
MNDSQTLSATRTVDGVEIPVPGTYTIDATHTQVSVLVRHLMVAKVRGHFRKFEATIVVAEVPEESTVTASIDAASIDTGDPNRDAHLRSPDFLDVEKYPTIDFKSTSVTHKGGGDFSVTGDLTLHGITKPITLSAEFLGVVTHSQMGTRMGISATGEVNRDDFNMLYNAPLETGGFLLGKTVKLELEAEAVLAS